MSDYGLGKDMASLLAKIDALENKLDTVLDELEFRPTATSEVTLLDEDISGDTGRQLKFNVGNIDAGPGCVRDLIVYFKDDGSWLISGKGGNASRHSTSYIRLKIGITKSGSDDADVLWKVWDGTFGPKSCASSDLANNGSRADIITHFSELANGRRKLVSNLYRKRVG